MPFGYTLDDFDGYFRNAWIVKPNTKEVSYVCGLVDRNTIAVNKNPNSEWERVPIADIDKAGWGNVCSKSLGYRNINGVLVHYTKRAGRNIKKGVSGWTITSTVSMAYNTVIPVRNEDYSLSIKAANAAVAANQLYFPDFPTFEIAMERLGNPQDSLFAVAISSLVALCLDPDMDNKLMCLMNEEVVGSLDLSSKQWEWYTPCGRDIAFRAGVK